MSVRWITWAWDQDCTSAGHKLTLIALADHAGEEGSAYPGCARLAEKTGQCERTIRRQLDDLEANRLLTRERRRRSDGSLGTYRYQLGTPPDIHDTAQRTALSGSPADTVVRAEPSVLNRQEEPSASLVVASDDRFEEFWVLYRRTGPKKVARAGWDKALKKPGVTPELLIEGLRKWVAYWDSPGAAKIKWPQGWFTEERWSDDPPSVAQAAAPNLSSGARALQRYMERTQS